MSDTATLQTTVGIYNALATIRRHRDGDVTINAPFVRWDDDNTGVLDYDSVTLTGLLGCRAKKLFSDDGLTVKNEYGDVYKMTFAEFMDEVYAAN